MATKMKRKQYMLSFSPDRQRSDELREDTPEHQRHGIQVDDERAGNNGGLKASAAEQTSW